MLINQLLCQISRAYVFGEIHIFINLPHLFDLSLFLGGFYPYYLKQNNNFQILCIPWHYLHNSLHKHSSSTFQMQRNQWRGGLKILSNFHSPLFEIWHYGLIFLNQLTMYPILLSILGPWAVSDKKHRLLSGAIRIH